MSSHSEGVAKFSEQIGEIKGELAHWEDVPRYLRANSSEPENIEIIHKDILLFVEKMKESCRTRIAILRKGIENQNNIQALHDEFMEYFNKSCLAIRDGTFDQAEYDAAQKKYEEGIAKIMNQKELG